MSDKIVSEQQKDHGASLLPVDPLASQSGTETLPIRDAARRFVQGFVWAGADHARCGGQMPGHCKVCDGRAEALLEGIDDILKEHVNQWQSIETAPKDDGQDLIICDGNDLVGHGFFNRADKRWDWLDGDPIRDARCWMPLPDPPKIGSGNQSSNDHSVTTRRSEAR